MTDFASEAILIATAAFATLGAAGSLASFLFAKPARADASARLGFFGGFLCGAILGAILIGNEAPSMPSVAVSFGPWVTFSAPQPLTLEFGLEATWLKAFLVSLLGGLILIAQWSSERSSFASNRFVGTAAGLDGSGSQTSTVALPLPESLANSERNQQLTRMPLAEDGRLACSLFYASVTFFIFAPNLAQALLGWAAASLLAGIIMRLFRVEDRRLHRVKAATQPALPAFGTFHFSDTGVNLRCNTSQRFGNPFDRTPHPSLRILAMVLSFLETNGLDRPWRFLSEQFPSWLGEQTDSLEESSASFQLLATVLASSAILLTWLVIS